MKILPQYKLDIMRIVWNLNKKGITITSKNVSAIMKDRKGWQPSSTITALGKLVKDGFLEDYIELRPKEFDVLIHEEEYLKFALEDFIENVHDGSVVSFIESLIELDLIKKDELKKELSKYYDIY